MFQYILYQFAVSTLCDDVITVYVFVFMVMSWKFVFVSPFLCFHVEMLSMWTACCTVIGQFLTVSQINRQEIWRIHSADGLLWLAALEHEWISICIYCKPDQIICPTSYSNKFIIWLVLRCSIPFTVTLILFFFLLLLLLVAVA